MIEFNIFGNEINTQCLNVKNYGAVGDGTTDDAPALNNLTKNIAKDGGVFYIPSGVYLLKSSWMFRSNQIFIFEPGAVLLSHENWNNLMMNDASGNIGEYNATENVQIIGATFDGGSGTRFSKTLLAFCHSKNIIIKDCKFINAYGTWHNFEINSSKNIIVDNCYFEGSTKTGSNGCMLQIDCINTEAGYPWGMCLPDHTVCKYIEIKNCIFENSTVVPGIGNHSVYSSEYIRIHDNTFIGLTTTRAAIALNSAINTDIYNNSFIDCTTGVTIYDSSTNLIFNNRFVGVTTVNSGGVKYYNNVNGSLVTN